MGIVGGHQRNARLFGKADQLGQHRLLLFKAVVLNFQVVIPMPEQVVVPQRNFLGAVVIPGQQRLRHLARQAGRQADQPFVVLLQQLMVHTRFGVEPLNKPGADHFNKVFIPGFIFAKQNQVTVSVNAGHLIKPGAGGHIHLTANDRLDARLFGRLVKIHTAVHNTVVGDGNGGLAQLLHAVKQLVNAARAVQQTVLRVYMQMGKLPFSHALSSPAGFLRSPASA